MDLYALPLAPTKKATPKDRLFHIESLLAYSTVPASAQHVLALVHKYIINSSSEPCDQAPPFAKGRGWGGNVNMTSKKLYMHLPTKKAPRKALFLCKRDLLTQPYQPNRARSRTCAYKASSARRVRDPSTYEDRTQRGCQRTRGWETPLAPSWPQLRSCLAFAPRPQASFGRA